jgi:hypothetical protein
MGRVEEMTDTARMLLNRTIEALLSEDSIEQRLSEVETCLSRLESYRTQIPGELNELEEVSDIIASSEGHLSPEPELELMERLLTLYISVSDGALIF